MHNAVQKKGFLAIWPIGPINHKAFQYVCHVYVTETCQLSKKSLGLVIDTITTC